MVVHGRVVDRDADVGEGGEVHHGFGFVLRHRANESLGFEQVGRDERQFADGRAMAFGEVVDDENIVAALGKLLGGVRADVAGSAGDEYAHGVGVLRLFMKDRGGDAPARWGCREY